MPSKSSVLSDVNRFFWEKDFAGKLLCKAGAKHDYHYANWIEHC